MDYDNEPSKIRRLRVAPPYPFLFKSQWAFYDASWSFYHCAGCCVFKSTPSKNRLIAPFYSMQAQNLDDFDAHLGAEPPNLEDCGPLPQLAFAVCISPPNGTAPSIGFSVEASQSGSPGEFLICFFVTNLSRFFGFCPKALAAREIECIFSSFLIVLFPFFCFQISK